jgi:hypothetical protein
VASAKTVTLVDSSPSGFTLTTVARGAFWIALMRSSSVPGLLSSTTVSGQLCDPLRTG